MKKIFAALTAILMIFAAVACGKNGGEIVDVEVNVPTADQTTAPEQTQAPADTDAPQDTLAPEQTQAPAETAAPVDPNLTP